VVFTSAIFALFFSLAAGAYYLVPSRLRPDVLLACSYLFYATWSIPYAGLLFTITVIVHRLGLHIAMSPEEGAKRRALALGVGASLTLLIAFKYAFPLLGGAGSAGGGLLSRMASLAVPIGISYYTFKLVSYLVDVYWEKLEPEPSLRNFSLYVGFFPQILSGPIERARTFLPQIGAMERSPFDAAMVTSGLRYILFGLFKKFAVAERIAPIVDSVFDNAGQHHGATILIAAYLFAIQIYADFSGLTDLVIGLGRVFGHRTPQNFDAPYYAPNIQEFWRRWHITLTSWVSDYLFAPLRIALRNWGNIGLVVAIAINMLAISLWHGVSSNFPLFAAVQTVYMSASALTLRRRNQFYKTRPRLAGPRRWLAPLLTFHLVVLSFIVFRAKSASDAWRLIRDLFHWSGPRASLNDLVRVGASPGLLLSALGLVGVMEAIHFAHRSGRLQRWKARSPAWGRWLVYYALALMILVFGPLVQQTFIYMQF